MHNYLLDILYAESGDRIWWTWGRNDIDAPFSVQEIEKCISPASLPKKAIENTSSLYAHYIK